MHVHFDFRVTSDLFTLSDCIDVREFAFCGLDTDIQIACRLKDGVSGISPGLFGQVEISFDSIENGDENIVLLLCKVR